MKFFLVLLCAHIGAYAYSFATGIGAPAAIASVVPA